MKLEEGEIVPASTLYDRAEALERLDGDVELFGTLAEMFVTESASYCKALTTALADADVPALRREAHTVKSMLATFSFGAGCELAMQLEHLAAAGRLDGAEALTASLIEAVQLLADQLAADLAC